jgi:hypothetical protein
MLPAEVAQAVREYEADSGDDNGRSEVDRGPAPGIILRPTGNRRFGGLRRTYLLDLHCERRLERILHSPNAVKGGHRGCHEQ